MPAITHFPLAWRWTNASHAEFSPAELASLHPLPPDKAARIHDAALRFLHAGSLDPQQFERIEGQSAEVSVAQRCSWLRSRQPNLNECVTLSWQHDTALQTTWQLFTERWDDFCYPASDDVFIIPDSGAWVLLYHHADTFYFASRSA